MPLTSTLLVPFHNETRYLPQLLQTCLKQTQPFSQIVLCNNGSTDNSLAAIKPFQSLLPIHIVTEPKPGIIPALKTALKAATGELILKTDADCLLPQIWHQHIQTYFTTHPHYAALTGPWYASDGNLIDRFLLSTAGSLGSAILALIRHPLLQGCNYSLRRTTLTQIYGYTDSSLPTDDQLLTHKLRQAGLLIAWSWSCYLYTSTRRYQGHPEEYFHSLRSLVTPQKYRLKIL